MTRWWKRRSRSTARSARFGRRQKRHYEYGVVGNEDFGLAGTGAGFGGCSVSLVREDAVERFIETVGKEYEKKIGYAASFYVSDIGDGGMELK